MKSSLGFAFCLLVSGASALTLPDIICQKGTLGNFATNGKIKPMPAADPTDTPPECTRPGERFPIPSDCTYYFFCLTTGIQVRQCPPSSYFDPATLNCIPGTCENQPATTSTENPPEITTTENPTETATTGNPPDTTTTETTPDTTTTENPPETTTKSTTTEPTTTTKAPPYCQKFGQRFPVPSDCHSFWQCLAVGSTPTYTTCPTDSYYDGTKQSCVSGYC